MLSAACFRVQLFGSQWRHHDSSRIVILSERVLSFGQLTSVLKRIPELGCRHCCVVWHTQCIVLQGHYCAVGRICCCVRQQLQILWWHSWNLIVTLCVIVGSLLKTFNSPGLRRWYRGADRLKKKVKGRHFSSDAEVIAAAETWLDGQPSDFFLCGLQKLEFGRCNLFPSWSG